MYTTPAPKSITASIAARRLVAKSQSSEIGQSPSPSQEPNTQSQDPESAVVGTVSSNDGVLKAPPVQPLADNTQLETDSSSSGYSAVAGERSVSAPLSYTSAPRTPPSSSTDRRAPPTSSAQRSISLSNGTHQNSPVMNETLSVIEEHITDMSTPRHSLLMPERNNIHNRGKESIADPVRRLSYINGNETEEEESGMLTEHEVKSWSQNRVAEHLEDMGVEPQHCQVFREQEISGEVLLGMDQGSLMLKEFELGSIGRRLALWQKVKAIQEEVRISRAVPRFSADHSTNGSFTESGRNRSTSVGTVLPRIPSLMEGSNSRAPSRQQMQRTPSHQKAHQTESLSALPRMTENRELGHEHRPSAASVRELQNRRHSSIDYSATSQTQSSGSPTKFAGQPSTSHKKNGSFDHSWTMGSTTHSPTDPRLPSTGNAQSPHVDPNFASFPHEVGMKIVSQLDLDRGYFSSNETDIRKPRNVLRKRTGESPSAHSRAPSDGGYSNRRLSGVFRHRAGSTDSLIDTSKAPSPSAAQIYYNGSNKPLPRATSGPQIGKSWRHASPSASPTVTKLDYTHTPSIDAVAASSPNLPGSETSSIERPIPSPAGRTLFTRSRATGLRAISDAITGDEKASLNSTKAEKMPSPIKEAPIQSPPQTGSSTPSTTSKSMEMDDSSMLKSVASSGSYSTAAAPSAPRRRGKKSTSAYTRGLEKKSPKEQMEGCDYSGWMKKKSSNLMTTWKTRLFVLRGRRLSYYYSENDTEEKGLIDISFHRVLPANNDRITGLHATFTGLTNSPTSPPTSRIPTTASTDAKNAPEAVKGDAPGIFIFKLVPPRPGLSKAVNFTRPTVHYFAVENVQQGRLWMAALMKATIDRDDGGQVVTTYKEQTISLAKARAMRQRPPALMGDDDDKLAGKGLAIDYSNDSNDAVDGAKEGSLTTNGTANTNSTDNLQREELKDISTT